MWNNLLIKKKFRTKSCFQTSRFQSCGSVYGCVIAFVLLVTKHFNLQTRHTYRKCRAEVIGQGASETEELSQNTRQNGFMLHGSCHISNMYVVMDVARYKKLKKKL